MTLIKSKFLETFSIPEINLCCSAGTAEAVFLTLLFIFLIRKPMRKIPNKAMIDSFQVVININNKTHIHCNKDDNKEILDDIKEEALGKSSDILKLTSEALFILFEDLNSIS
ncbi:hypothetical protein JCM31447_25570 [Fluviispira sanaruensis]|uniref:Uncharacterized protein n=1 Tax=Fluviispira sanaruensis TaxID=2493639 RepID=A0A4P2VPH9_FLUSA|nr:hypothetical protein JCM31447_25570 [Fluviispira sanaruensis]